MSNEIPPNLLNLSGYTINRKIGEGGMANVFLAEHHGLETDVALKVLSGKYAEDKAFISSFISEAKRLAKLDHNNIVRVYDVHSEEGLHYIAMQYLPGGDFRAKLKAGVAKQEAIECVKQIAEALSYSASQGLVHLDVKPENFMFAEDGRAVLTDFGIARDLDQNTSEEQVVGTPRYMSPEQASREAVDLRSDLYSLAIIAYEVVTGKVPFDQGSPGEIAGHQIHSIPPAVGSQESAFQSFFDKALAKDPIERFQTAKAFIAGIDAVDRNVLEGQKTVVLSEVTPPSANRIGKLHKVIIFVLLVLIASLGTLTLFAGLSDEEKQLLGKVDDSLSKGELLEPVASSAKFFLDQLLKENSGDKEVQTRTSQLIRELLDRAELSISKDELMMADRDLKVVPQLLNVLEVGELHARYKTLHEKLHTLKLEAAAQNSINELLQEASDQEKQNKLYSPPGDCALETYQRVLGKAPGNITAERGLERISNQLIKQALQEARSGEFEKARELLVEAERAWPQNENIQQAQQDVISIEKGNAPETNDDVITSQLEDELAQIAQLINDGVLYKPANDNALDMLILLEQDVGSDSRIEALKINLVKLILAIAEDAVQKKDEALSIETLGAVEKLDPGNETASLLLEKLNEPVVQQEQDKSLVQLILDNAFYLLLSLMSVLAGFVWWISREEKSASSGVGLSSIESSQPDESLKPEKKRISVAKKINDVVAEKTAEDKKRFFDIHFIGQDGDGQPIHVRVDGKQLASQGSVIIGREATMSDYQIDWHEISRSHAKVYMINEQVFVEDLGSLNHTWVNGVQAHKGQKLVLISGNQLQLGTVILQVSFS